jgi:O-succinylhomoserine sulfhydrylase
LTEVSDIAALSKIAKKARALLAVDNVFCTPALQRPIELGADLVIHSATKYLDGQGRVIAGAVAGPKALVGDPMTVFLRNAGPTLSPFNAWVVLKGLETLELRMQAQSAAAHELASWLESHPKVNKVFYPGLRSHPQYELAKRQQRAAGSVLSFEVKGARAAAWRVIDAARLMSVTANLGDVKTTIIHPASTTHGRISQAARDAAGITEGLIRIAVGLEAVNDLKEDLSRGLEAE